ncbi:TIM barrel protein [Paenibacillus sp. PL2-23]|uniref:hydroxypyruvate isomerase family protein n=1 Tax=Paenibacillus sp. PL2-23 TaxID=2100729 RepID=UPI0030F69C97
MKFSVCIDALYNKQPSAEAIRALHQAGGVAFEFWSWTDKDLEAIRRTKDELGMTLTTLLAKHNNLVDPAQREQYLAGIVETIEVARSLGCSRILTTTGNEMNVPREVQHRSVVEGLKAAAPLVAEAGMILLLEPLNIKVNHPGYFLYRSDEAFSIIREVNEPAVKLLFDIYHQYITEGEVIPDILEGGGSIGHFHAAGYPGRHELHIGEMDYDAIFAAIRESGYDGYVGLEYFPQANPADGLEQLLRTV